MRPSKPEKIPVKNLVTRVRRPIDVFICSASFEIRSRTVADQIPLDFVKSVLICENEDLRPVVEPSSTYLHSRFGAKAISVQLNTKNPLLGADNMLRAISSVEGAQLNNFLIDITAFTHESLLILLKLLQQFLHKGNKVQCVYTGASDYAVGMEQEDKWLSKGIGEIRSVLGYPGMLRPSRKVHLIVLVGFEGERAAKLIEAYEPTIVSLGFGSATESISGSLHKVNMAFHKKLAALYRNVLDFSFSCIDPLETKKAIEAQMAKVLDHNTVIAAMNTKISTIGAALAAFSDETIQLCYAHANQYNWERYSAPSEECYLFDLREIGEKVN